MIETFIKALSEKCLQAISQSARKTTINITFNTIYTRILTYYITLHPTKNFGVVQQSKPAKFNIYTPPTLAGFFFCPAAIQPNTSVYSAFCAVNAVIQPPQQNSAQGFTVAFLAIAPAQLPTIPDRHKRL